MKIHTKCDACQEPFVLKPPLKELNFCCYGCEVRYKKAHKKPTQAIHYKKPEVKNTGKTYKDYLQEALKRKEVDSVYKTFKRVGKGKRYDKV